MKGFLLIHDSEGAAFFLFCWHSIMCLGEDGDKTVLKTLTEGAK